MIADGPSKERDRWPTPRTDARVCAPHRRHRRVGHPGRRRQGQGPEGGGRAGDRLRRRRARLPDAGPHRRGRRRRLPRPEEPPVHAGRRPPRAEGGHRRQDGARLRATRCHQRAGAGHQRRQARRLQHLRHPARPGRRGAPPGAVLDHLPRADRPRRRACRWCSPPTRPPASGSPSSSSRRPAPTRTKVLRVRVALEPHRRGVPAPTRSRPSAAGPSSTASGSSPTRSTSTSPTATTGSRSMPALVPELADRCVVLNGVAKTYAMTGWRVGWMIGPADVIKAATNLQSPRHVQRRQREPAGRPRRPHRRPRRRWPRCAPPSSGAGQLMHKLLTGIEGVTALEPQGAFYGFPNLVRVPRAADPRPHAPRTTVELCARAARRGQGGHRARARRSTRPATPGSATRWATTTSARAAGASPTCSAEAE